MNEQFHLAIIRAGLTQRVVAERAGVPEAYISLAIHKKYNLSDDQQGRIAEVLGVKKEEIF